MNLGESKVLEFRAAVLRLYLFIAVVASVITVPIYYYIGIDVLTALCALFALNIIVLTVLFNQQRLGLTAATGWFLSSLILVCLAGLYLGNETIDNKPWQLIVPLAAFTVAGARAGWTWSLASLAGAIAVFVERWPAYDLLAILVLVLTYLTCACTLYVFNRHNEANIRIIARLSHTDSLTGTFNRQLFEELSRAELNRARRNSEPFVVYMIDIDHFKRFNDRYGHVAGDRALASVARVIRNSARRASDLVFRYGGEEFCVVVSASAVEEAGALAASIVEGVRKLAIRHEDSERGILTVSIGLSHHADVGDASIERIITRADQALYAAKKGGRDRVEWSISRHVHATAERTAGATNAAHTDPA